MFWALYYNIIYYTMRIRTNDLFFTWRTIVVVVPWLVMYIQRRIHPLLGIMPLQYLQYQIHIHPLSIFICPSKLDIIHLDFLIAADIRFNPNRSNNTTSSVIIAGIAISQILLLVDGVSYWIQPGRRGIGWWRSWSRRRRMRIVGRGWGRGKIRIIFESWGSRGDGQRGVWMTTVGHTGSWVERVWMRGCSCI